jgi:hypothetical protein
LLFLVLAQTGAHCGTPVFAPHVRSHHLGAHGADVAPSAARVQPASGDCLSAAQPFDLTRAGAFGAFETPLLVWRTPVAPSAQALPHLSRTTPTAPPLPLRI